MELLDLGYSCRQVAELMGKGCSSGTPIRWKQQLMGTYNRAAKPALGRKPKKSSGRGDGSKPQDDEDSNVEVVTGK